MITMKVQNIYGDFLRSFKVFLDKVTHQTLTKIEWNYGAKPLEYYYMQNHESFEYPTAIVEIQDIQPLNGVSSLARSSGMRIMSSVHQILACENKTLEQKVVLDKRWVNLMFTVTINTEDVTTMLNYHDLFLNHIPYNFLFYDYTFWGQLEVTNFVQDWDFDNDDTENVFLQLDPTYRYTADQRYNEAVDPAFHTSERDREAGRDLDVVREGERYFSMIKYKPILKLNSITKQTDKESQQHSITMSFEAQIELPNVLLWIKEYTIESIEIVIDTVSKHNQLQPILIDIPDNFLTNKNIQREIGIFSEAFVFPDPTLDPDADPYLEVKTYIDLDLYTVSLWAVENVTETSSKRFFIPLEHATVEIINDQGGNFESMRFYFEEMEWFRDFDLQNPFNYFKLLLFKED